MQIFNWGIRAAVERLRRPTRSPSDLPLPVIPEQTALFAEPPAKTTPKAPKQVAIPWPEDFKLGDVQIKFAADRGFNEIEMQRMWERFRDRNIAKGEKYVGQRGWEAAWRTWVNNQVEFKNRDNRGPRGPGDQYDGRA